MSLKSAATSLDQLGFPRVSGDEPSSDLQAELDL